MKDSMYFQHDYNARNDDKLLAVREKFGNEGYALFWYCIETMAERGDGYLIATLLGGLSLGYNVPIATLIAFVEFCVEIGLFMKDERGYCTKRIVEHLKIREGYRTSGKKGADSRWKNRGAIATLIAKESKVKKRKKNLNNTNVLLNSKDFVETDKVKEAGIETIKKPTRLFEVCDLYFQAQRYLASGGKERCKLQDQSKEFIESFIQRNAKSAKLLSPYSNAQIKRAINYCVELSTQSKADPEGGWDWTLETVGKKIDRVLSPNQVTHE